MKRANWRIDNFGSSKEMKAVIVKDLTFLIDRLLEDGSLLEKMILDDQDQVLISFQNLFNNPEVKSLLEDLQVKDKPNADDSYGS